MDPLQFNEINCLKFLTDLYKAGKCYSALNTARSALSSFIFSESGLPIGKSNLLRRFFKGVFELQPIRPRYRYIWDVSIVLDMLRFYHPNEHLPLSILSHKCAMLLALSSMQRAQTLVSINVGNIKIYSDSILIPIDKMLKHFRVNFDSCTIHLKKYDDLNICPCDVLKHYIEKTREIRGEHTQLFISYTRPFKPIT